MNREEFIRVLTEIEPEEDIITLKFIPESDMITVSETRSEYTETPPSVSSIKFDLQNKTSFSEERKIALYSKYFIETLTKLKSEYVTLSFKDLNNIEEQNWMLCPNRLKGEFTTYMAAIKLNYEEVKNS